MQRGLSVTTAGTAGAQAWAWAAAARRPGASCVPTLPAASFSNARRRSGLAAWRRPVACDWRSPAVHLFMRDSDIASVCLTDELLNSGSQT
jgi:hypothetical protein